MFSQFALLYGITALNWGKYVIFAIDNKPMEVSTPIEYDSFKQAEKHVSNISTYTKTVCIS